MKLEGLPPMRASCGGHHRHPSSPKPALRPRLLVRFLKSKTLSKRSSKRSQKRSRIAPESQVPAEPPPRKRKRFRPDRLRFGPGSLAFRGRPDVRFGRNAPKTQAIRAETHARNACDSAALNRNAREPVRLAGAFSVRFHPKRTRNAPATWAVSIKRT